MGEHVFVIEREELQHAINAGMSIADLAELFACSKGSVRHWLGKYGLGTLNPAKRDSTAAANAARAAGLSSFVGTCERHGETRFIREANGYYRCTACRSERVSERRRQLKATLVAEAGGACVICGYGRTPRALEFHHLDPTTKLFALSAAGVTMSLRALRAEAQKCVLLCSNCHAEVEDGLLTVSIN